MGLVNVLQRGLMGMSTRVIYKATHVPGVFAIIIGAAITVLVQSSSITTSVLTPLVGIGVIQLEQMLPLTLGANIGTTVTGLLAALVSGKLEALQVALAHLFFNLSGIAVWYPIPFMRRVPLNGAKALGKWTHKSRSIPPIYVATVFFAIPLLLLGLSELFIKILSRIPSWDPSLSSLCSTFSVALFGFGISRMDVKSSSTVLIVVPS